MSSWPSKPILRLVLGDEVQEPGELVALAPEVGVEQRVVALAAAPQDVVLPAEALGDLEHVLDLRRGEREHLGIGVGRRARLVARVGEQVGGPPQEPHARPLLVAGGVVGQRVEVGAERREALALWGDVAIVEAVVRRAELLEELERDGHLRPRRRHLVVGRGEPRPVERPDAEHVDARPRERMPEAHAGPQVVLHPRAQDQPVRLVDLERQGVVGVEAAERDRPRHLGEERLAHARTSSPSCCHGRRRAPVPSLSLPRPGMFADPHPDPFRVCETISQSPRLPIRAWR